MCLASAVIPETAKWRSGIHTPWLSFSAKLAAAMGIWSNAMIANVARPALGLVLILLAEPAFAHHVMGGQTPVTFMQGLLSGIGHPVIGLDHLAAVIAVGCLAATQSRGEWLAPGYVLAMMIGAAAHIGEATVPGSEIFVAVSVIALGLLLVRRRPLRMDVAIALFAFAGLVHGYALGESIAGAERMPLYAYFIGLALIQSAVVLAVLFGVRTLATHKATASLTRVLGACVAGIGLAVLAQQLFFTA
jgi:urease accessory protein